MKKLFYYANQYIQKSSWKDLALIKFWHQYTGKKKGARGYHCGICFYGDLYSPDDEIYLGG